MKRLVVGFVEKLVCLSISDTLLLRRLIGVVIKAIIRGIKR